MTIVTGVPDNIRAPGTYGTIDNSQAVLSVSLTTYKILLIGTKTPGSSGPVDEVVQLFGDSDGLQWGEGGMLDRMTRIAKANNQNSPMYAIALDENGGGTAFETDMTIPAGTATATGVLHMYIQGDYVPVPVAEGDDQDAIAASAQAAIAAATGLSVTATVATNVTTITSKFAGAAGNSITVQFNRGIKESFPPGISEPTFVDTPGTLDPSIAPAIAAMVDEQFTHIVLPYEDTTNQDLLLNELNDRFGPIDQQWGISFTMLKDSASNLIAYGNARNSQLQCYPSVDPGTAGSLFEGAAGLVAKGVTEGDPARPWQTLGITGFAGAKSGVGLKFSFTERNQLLFNGIATTKVADDGTVQIERTVTSYQTNPAGADDISYLDLMTPVTACVWRDAVNNRFRLKFPRHKLGGSGNAFGAGQPVLTPELARAEIISVFRDFVERAILEDEDQFIESLVVEISSSDKNRLEYSCNPNLVNQFRVLAGVNAFIL